MPIPRIHNHRLPPQGPHAKGDIWNEIVGNSDRVRWKWDGHVWVYQSDTITEDRRRDH